MMRHIAMQTAWYDLPTLCRLSVAWRRFCREDDAFWREKYQAEFGRAAPTTQELFFRAVRPERMFKTRPTEYLALYWDDGETLVSVDDLLRWPDEVYRRVRILGGNYIVNVDADDAGKKSYQRFEQLEDREYDVQRVGFVPHVLELGTTWWSESGRVYRAVNSVNKRISGREYAALGVRRMPIHPLRDLVLFIAAMLRLLPPEIQNKLSVSPIYIDARKFRGRQTWKFIVDAGSSE